MLGILAHTQFGLLQLVYLLVNLLQTVVVRCAEVDFGTPVSLLAFGQRVLGRAVAGPLDCLGRPRR